MTDRKSDAAEALEGILSRRPLILDGAMGTMIQRLKPEGVVDYDLLCVTHPELIARIHREYIEAGADIIETNTFNANAISLSERSLSGRVEEINLAGARIARAEADAASTGGRRIFVAGSMGPSNVALSMPAAPGEKRLANYRSMSDAYRNQALALMQGGVDLLLLETIFDTVNAKAAIAGILQAFEVSGERIPVMLSATVSDGGRTLSGQSLLAFVASPLQADPFSIGLNCGFGASMMAPHVETLGKYGCYISLHPNAGLPDALGQYTESPESMAAALEPMLRGRKVNIVGGCCGTTPAHIRAISRLVHRLYDDAGLKPRVLPVNAPDREADTMLLSGLEAEKISPAVGFVKVGERCNVAGSRKFLRLINEGDGAQALGIAASQLSKGAGVLDINMDDGLPDAQREMQAFVTSLQLDASTASAPLMIDSSSFEVIEGALQKIQGRSIVNSISLKEGEEEFLRKAMKLRRYGAAVVVMAFDEGGQAVTFERRVAICRRAYRLLTERCGYRGCDIIFDPNILTIATGIPEHDRYALDFLEATAWIKRNLPGAKVSGGVSNLSFAFRGHNGLREAMHTVFLHHAIERGMDMAIVNPSTTLDIASVDPMLREAIEDLIFCRRPDATPRLMEIAAALQAAKEDQKRSATGAPDKVASQVEAKTMSIREMVVKGVADHLETRLEEALAEEGSAMKVVANRLMTGMNDVGEAFGAGRMFLPQVVRSAGVMKQAIAWLTPYIERENASSGASRHIGRIVLATVKGDVHDIGKNIVAVIMRCSNFEVIDLGVMVEAETIIQTAKEKDADIIGLSGLITPSLAEMANVARRMQEEGLRDIVLCVGGATTSDIHTAVKIAPEFEGITLHTRDAAALPDIAAALCDPERRARTAASIRAKQRQLREAFETERVRRPEVSLSGLPVSQPSLTPKSTGLKDFEFSPAELLPLVNWKEFYHVWQVAGTDPAGEEERRRLRAEAESLVDRLDADGIRIHGRVVTLPARRRDDDIILDISWLNGDEDASALLLLPTLRRESAPRIATSDFLAKEGDWLSLFAVTVGERLGNMINETRARTDYNSEYESLLLQSVADRLAEAATDRLHTIVHYDLWGMPEDSRRGVRPAFGYPSLPDQTLVLEADKVLDYKSMGIRLTENGALWPSASTTGLIFVRPEARYFEVGELSDAAIEDYGRRRSQTPEKIRNILNR